MRRLRHLTGQHRTSATNRLLGGLLALSLPPLWADFQRLNRLRKARLARESG